MMTGKMTTIARPYANAVFEYALANNALPAWEAMLNAATCVTENSAAQQLLNNPALTSQQLADLYCDVLTALLNQEMKNFLLLLAENHRLAALPDIAALFKQLRAEQEKAVVVQVTSAVQLDAQYQQTLAAALSRRLQRHVSLHCDTDADLLGGAVITAGDLVIDGSVRGKLNRLVECLSGNS